MAEWTLGDIIDPPTDTDAYQRGMRQHCHIPNVFRGTMTMDRCIACITPFHCVVGIDKGCGCHSARPDDWEREGLECATYTIAHPFHV